MTSDFPFPTDAGDPGWALSPLDGRYRSATYPLTQYLSEDAINRLRVFVEIEWLIFLSEHSLVDDLVPLTTAETQFLRELPSRFDDSRRTRLAELEAETRHDVKAVEYLLREYLSEYRGTEGDPPLTRYAEAVHLLATSEDINNLAIALGVRGTVEDVWLPAASALVATISDMAQSLADVPMLSRTHGQSATPTTVGKELAVFAWRLQRQVSRIEDAEYLGKFNGATGTHSAHQVVLPHWNWLEVAMAFVMNLGLTWNPITTQIESHDWQTELYSDVARFNRIAHNLATDMWTYISLGYFRQELSAQGSTGSSTMPHKINPIRFENAEANLELSNAILDVLSQTLSTSRMQRDLSDSSMQRNIGVGFGYSLVALNNLVRGLRGLTADHEALSAELDGHWEVISEALQQGLRVAELQKAAARWLSPVDDGNAEGAGDDTAPSTHSVPADASDHRNAPSAAGPYESLKEATRGRAVSRDDLMQVVDSASLPAELASRLRNLSPGTYTGLSEQIANLLDDR